LGILSAGPLQATSAADTADEIASQWLEIINTVLAKHVDPPVRQEKLSATTTATRIGDFQEQPIGRLSTESILDPAAICQR
jgi:hypothetical protein